MFDPVATLVYSATREQVTDTWVAGGALMRDRHLTTLDVARLERTSDAWQARLAGYAETD